jgi:hypothetical protein
MVRAVLFFVRTLLSAVRAVYFTVRTVYFFVRDSFSTVRTVYFTVRASLLTVRTLLSAVRAVYFSVRASVLKSLSLKKGRTQSIWERGVIYCGLVSFIMVYRLFSIF